MKKGAVIIIVLKIEMGRYWIAIVMLTKPIIPENDLTSKVGYSALGTSNALRLYQYFIISVVIAQL